MVYEKLDKRVKKVWRISRGITFFIFILIYGISLGIIYGFDGPDEVKFWGWIVVLATTLIFIFAIIVAPEIQYRQWGYYIGEDKVEIRKGLFFITTQIIPVIRIQHINSEKGPVDRAFKLAKVEISTASGQFQINGLDEERVVEISENLKNKLIKRLEKEEGKC